MENDFPAVKTQGILKLGKTQNIYAFIPNLWHYGWMEAALLIKGKSTCKFCTQYIGK